MCLSLSPIVNHTMSICEQRHLLVTSDKSLNNVTSNLGGTINRISNRDYDYGCHDYIIVQCRDYKNK